MRKIINNGKIIFIETIQKFIVLILFMLITHLFGRACRDPSICMFFVFPIRMWRLRAHSYTGLGRRCAHLSCETVEVEFEQCAGDLTADEVKKLVTVIHCPRQYKIRLWFSNRQQDSKTGNYSQIVS